jgi:Leucine-rich repeat (LRR) protein
MAADCRRLQLSHAPRFSENVQRIDLSTNRLSEIPADMPPRIVSLNIYNNRIKDPEKEILSRYKQLRWLNIGNNCLWLKNNTWPSRFFSKLNAFGNITHER